MKGVRKKPQLSQPFLLWEMFLRVPRSWDEVLGLVQMCKGPSWGFWGKVQKHEAEMRVPAL